MKISKEKWIEYFEYLDDLRESGATNMFGAQSYLLDEFFELDKKTAKTVLLSWMNTFDNNKTPKERIKNIHD